MWPASDWRPCVPRLLRFFCFIFVFLVLQLNEATAIIQYGQYDVATRFGIVRGAISKTIRGRYIANFLGLPYAEPPVGPLRFRSPKPWTTEWPRLYNAAVDKSMCIQQNAKGQVIGHEDCLYLNVFVPWILNRERKTKKLPVMVFLHGGAFNSGSSDSKLFPGYYLLDQDMILVTLNYRLNALGFFSTASKASPGNYGLKDIVMALRWVNENIRSFGGDPESVTLYGHSAGATAAHILTLTNKTEGLFDKYILQSGSALSTWAVHPQKSIRNASFEMAAQLNCLPPSPRPSCCKLCSNVTVEQNNDETVDADYYTASDEEKIMECMRSVDPRKIASLQGHYAVWYSILQSSSQSWNSDSNAVEGTSWVWKKNPLCVFGPTIEEDDEDAVLTMHPVTAMKNRLFRDIPRIVGFVEDEGLIKSIGFHVAPNMAEEFIENYETYLPYVTEYDEVISNFTAFADAIEDFYFEGNVSKNLLNNVTEMIGDALFVWPMYRALKYQAGQMNSSTYLFRFSYKGTFSNTLHTDRTKRYGISHGDDLNYLFPYLNYLLSDQQLRNTENDITMINIMTEMWHHFMVYGFPQAWRVPAWPMYETDGQYLRLGSGRSSRVTVEDDRFKERMAFWESLTEDLAVESAPENMIVGNETTNEAQNGIGTRSYAFDSLLLVLLATILGVC